MKDNGISRRGRSLTRARKGALMVLALLAALLAWAGVDAALIWFYRPSDAPRADAAVVLGASTWHDQPSEAFAARIDHAIRLYRAGRVRCLIFTGGQAPGEPISNAEAARRYALARGIPDADILVEPDSRYTRENLAYAKRLAVRRGLGSFVIVSDPLHLRRAMAMASDQGLRAFPSATPTTRYRSLRSRLWFLRRETYFLMQYQLVTRFCKIPEPPADGGGTGREGK